ncbi:unnamed protein product [Lepeophtheirus salmonis]|uniref:(salmon louse) hypothetical protein n=1 Tax=Lepeophtheirus salmonis TaxID=72036 RepID=A0A7R8CIX0_LEPSM|nr:unnamed protein product [Lepeophtheirus salmonis]CAF2798939.1 unnamed protein product [Lepeophtheirus salmonis]
MKLFYGLVITDEYITNNRFVKINGHSTCKLCLEHIDTTTTFTTFNTTPSDCFDKFDTFGEYLSYCSDKMIVDNCPRSSKLCPGQGKPQLKSLTQTVSTHSQIKMINIRYLRRSVDVSLVDSRSLRTQKGHFVLMDGVGLSQSKERTNVVPLEENRIFFHGLSSRSLKDMVSLFHDHELLHRWKDYLRLPRMKPA